VKEHHFVRPGGPLGPFATTIGPIWLLSLCLRQPSASAHTIRRSEPLARLRRALAAQLNEVQAQRFAAFRRARGRVTLTSPASVRPLLAFLRSISVVAERAEAEGPFESFSGPIAASCSTRGARRQDRRGTSRCRPPLLSRRRKGAGRPRWPARFGRDLVPVDDLQTTELALGEEDGCRG